MQLKMAIPFDSKLVEQIVLNEGKHISDIFSKMILPMMEEENDEKEKEENCKIQNTNKVKPTKRVQSFEELQARLKELQGKGKLNYKERNLKKGLQNRIKKKSKKEARRVQKKLARTEQLATSKVKEENGEASKIPKQKPIFNSEGHMVFSKFDFSQVGIKRKLKSEKNPKKILQQIEQKKHKVQELIKFGELEKADEIKEKEAWNSVLAKARGEKVKDDPELLKKTIKREEQLKKRSAKKWESRVDSVQKTIQDKQQKRQENILKRKKEKKTNKLKKASKKGRIIPGF